ncbi:MAG TPA: hypothetical protein VMZ73_06685 [Acidimicrobiales bacterium]|nr:hypothetical protein [Acidimicrobiales bacterium]
MLDSRPAKEPVIDAEVLRAEWRRRAAAVGTDALELPTFPARPGTALVDREAVIAEALARVAAESATWLAADLAREIATLVPAGAAATAAELVELVDELAAEAARRCVELHPPAWPVAATAGRSPSTWSTAS